MNLQQKVRQTISKYKLAKKSDKILVALSGGKDSSVTVYLLAKFGYNLEAIHINLRMGKYSERCLATVKKLCEDLKIKLNIYDIKKETGKTLLQIIKKNKKKRLSNCTICGVFKKWILNKKARKLKADKIATGHHLDDEIQTFMMNIFKGSPELSANIGPISKNIESKKFIPRIKPLFFISEKEIESYVKKNKLPFIKSICPYRSETYRIETRRFLNKFSNKDRQNIMKNFDIISKRIQKIKDTRMQYCRICGELSRNEICKKCELMSI